MATNSMEKFDGRSMDLEKVGRERLHEAFPECFAEGKLDIDKLLALCGEYIDKSSEKYQFEWNGKRESLRLAQTRSTGTLRPAPEERVDWDTTQNLYIEGDNLEVLKLLQTAYYRKVKMIYIDPPYNTGHDFVYNDDFADPMSRYKEITSQMTKSNPEVAGRFHTNWLNMMYPRLRLASNLLRDDGVIFISIDDNEVHNLRKLCDEVFGEENFLADIIWNSTKSVTNTAIVSVSHTHNLVYFKSLDYYVKNRHEFRLKDDGEGFANPDNDPRGPWKADPFQVGGWRPNQQYEITNPNTGEVYKPNPNCSWKNDHVKFQELMADNRIVFGKSGDAGPQRKRFLSEAMERGKVTKTIWDDVETTTNGTQMLKNLFGEAIFDNPKPVSLIKRMLELCTSGDDIVMDFFSGSATTAHAVMQLNAEDGGHRRFILVQLPEVLDGAYKTICEIGKERIRRAGAKIKGDNGMFQSAVDTGFKVFKLDDSNLAAWNTTPIKEEELPQLWDRFTALTETIKPNRTDLDVVYEVMAKMGVPLTYPVCETIVGTKKAYSVGDNDMLLVCLEKGITPEDVEAMCDLRPYWIIAAEEAFADDTALSNAHYTVKARGIKMELL